MAGTVAQQASEFFLRTSFPFIFSGLLPVSGVILASATDSNLGRIVTGQHKSPIALKVFARITWKG